MNNKPQTNKINIQEDINSLEINQDNTTSQESYTAKRRAGRPKKHKQSTPYELIKKKN
jgi:hypothetical protein